MTSPSFSQRYTGGQYLDQNPDWHAGDAEWKASKVLEMIRRHRLEPKSLCDVGCGVGEILVELHKHLPASVQFHGFDISPQAIDIAKTKENDRLHFERRDFLNETHDHYDILLLLDVFEHVPDYLTFLNRLRSRARRFIFHVPLDAHAFSVLRGSRYMLEMRKEFGHLHYFTHETALATLEDSGYRVLDHFHTWDGETDRIPLRYPFRAGIQWLDRMLFTYKPRLAASLRPHFNTLVLAEAA